MLDYSEFVDKEKSIVIAPAGYGKTHTISESVLHTNGKQLILTHTHAGVASIKEKLRKLGVSKFRYNVETITSYAQKFVFGFCTKDDIPAQEDSKDYFPFIIEEAIRLVKVKPISEVVSNTYTGLFVDEYQDCTLIQHEFIQALSNLLSTRLLGDYLQGIFDFTGDLVDLKDDDFLGAFAQNKFELTIPWRWKNTNPKLGEDLKRIRSALLGSVQIRFDVFRSVDFIKISPHDFRNYRSNFYKVIWSLVKEESLLIIHPDSTNIHARLSFIKTFKNKFRLLESIDSDSFYSISKMIDDASIEDLPKLIREICLKLFNKTSVNKWFNEHGFKNKTKPKDKEILKPVKKIIEELDQLGGLNYKGVSEILMKISDIPDFICYRKEVFNNVCSALVQAQKEKISVYEAMIQNRNKVRMIGRKIYGRCIGTTLLTKGLEFDTVCILHAEKFKCPKHFYVAVTRASKRLIIISQKEELEL